MAGYLLCAKSRTFYIHQRKNAGNIRFDTFLLECQLDIPVINLEVLIH